MASPIFALAPLLALGLTACGEPPWPEVSQDNCRPFKTIHIRDRERRAEFMDFCRAIPRSAWPIQPDKWLALTEGERAVHAKNDPLAPRLSDTPNPLNWLAIKP